MSTSPEAITIHDHRAHPPILMLFYAIFVYVYTIEVTTNVTGSMSYAASLDVSLCLCPTRRTWSL